MALSGNGKGWPTPEQELVLRAAVMERDAALDAWERLDPPDALEQLDRASLLVLPLVFRNFQRNRIKVAQADSLKGLYRSAWVRNQLLFNASASALRELESAGIPSLLLKGGALAQLDYQDAGVRPMADLDLLVRPGQLDAALATLSAAGWRRRSARSLSRLDAAMEALHADPLVSPAGHGIDLHWRVLLSLEPEEDLWREVVPVSLGGTTTRSLGAADRLLHVCVHGLVPHTPPAIRWVTDADTIIRRHPIEWDRLVERARRHEVSLSMSRALGYLRRVVESPVPESVVAELGRGPHSRIETAAFQATLQPRSLREVVRFYWYRYRRVEPRRLRAILGFSRYLSLELRYDSRRDFARHVMRRLLGRKGGSARV
jgi:hypothetical protein